MGCLHSKQQAVPLPAVPSSASGTTLQRTPDTEITITGSASSPSDGKPAAGTRASSATALTQPSSTASLDSRFEHIIEGAKELFQAPTARITLLEGQKRTMWFQSVGGLQPHEPLIVWDTSRDSRFRGSQLVPWPPLTRFYAAVPMLSVDGQVVGSLEVLDGTPKAHQADAAGALCFLASMAARELEREQGDQREQRSRGETALLVRNHTLRALLRFMEPALLCNVVKKGWPIIWANAQLTQTTGLSERTLLSSGGFWELFSSAADGDSSARADWGIRERQPFVLTVAGGTCTHLRLEFRPATANHLSSLAPWQGDVAFAEEMDEGVAEALDIQHYFAVVREAFSPPAAADGTSRAASPSLAAATADQAWVGGSGRGGLLLPAQAGGQGGCSAGLGPGMAAQTPQSRHRSAAQQQLDSVQGQQVLDLSAQQQRQRHELVEQQRQTLQSLDNAQGAARSAQHAQHGRQQAELDFREEEERQGSSLQIPMVPATGQPEGQPEGQGGHVRHARADSSAPGTDSTLWGAAEMLRHTFVSPFQRMATTKQTGPAPAAAASPAIAASPTTAAAAAVAGIAVPHGEESPPCLPGDRLLPPRSPGQHMESAVATASWTGSTGSPATSIPLAQAAQAAQQQAQHQQHQPPPQQQAQQARHVQQTQQSPHAQQVQRAQQAQQAQQPNYGLLVEAQQRQLQQHRLGLGPLSEAGLAASSAADMVEAPQGLAGIKLGRLLGRGSFGEVHRATWQGADVAVKIVKFWADQNAAELAGPMLEGLLSKNLMHPNILQTFAYGVKHAEVPERRTAEASTCAGRVYQQVWIVQQYANHGTLADAIECGWLRHRDGPQAGQPNMPHILNTTLEVASALAYLHSHGIVHGDLSGSNVFLVGMTQRQPGSRPFVAKVGDFGLSRLMDHGQLTTSTCGTVTNMPLELISRGLPTSAMDVFSFGVLCHEMLTGQRAWAGRSLMQILFARTEARQQLHVPDHCPPGYRHLLESCLQEDHLHRPPFADIVK